MSPGPITPLEAVARRLERGAFKAEKALRSAEEKQKPRDLIEQIRERVFDRRRHAQACRDADVELGRLRAERDQLRKALIALRQVADWGADADQDDIAQFCDAMAAAGSALEGPEPQGSATS